MEISPELLKYFHSATLVGDWIYVIGCLGYSEDREPGRTPDCQLHTESLSFETLDPTGSCPGWIHKHRTEISGRDTLEIIGGIVVARVNDEESPVPNVKRFQLDLRTLQWRVNS